MKGVIVSTAFCYSENVKRKKEISSQTKAVLFSLIRQTTLMTLPGFCDVPSFSFSVEDMVVLACEPPSSVAVMTASIVILPCVVVTEGVEVVVGRKSVVELCC